MSDIPDLVRLARESWPRPSGLVLGLGISLSAAAASANFLPKIYSVAVACVASTVTLVAWWKTQRLKRCPKGKFGFVIAISVDTPETYRIFERDFCKSLEGFLRQGALKDHLWVYHVPQFRLMSSLSSEQAQALRVETRAAFVLFGQVRTRDEETRRHYLDLEGVVAHAPTTPENTKRLGREFREILPQRLIADANAELPAFELGSSLSSVAAKYIAGIATFLSGYVEYAEAMYSDALSQATPLASKFPLARKVVERIPMRRTELALAKAKQAYEAWRTTHAQSCMDEMCLALDSAPEAAASTQPEWRTLKAVSVVVNADDNWSVVEDLVKKTDWKEPATQMNLAFLSGVKGDLRAASRHYRRAAELNVSADTIEEVMDFLEWFRKYRDRYLAEMCFLLGFISCHLLKDYTLSKGYFLEFRDNHDGRYLEEDRLVDKWLDELTPQRSQPA